MARHPPETACAAYVQRRAEPVGDGAFAGRVNLAAFGPRSRRSAPAASWSPSLPDGAGEHRLVGVQVAGTGRVSQGGRTAGCDPTIGCRTTPNGRTTGL